MESCQRTYDTRISVLPKEDTLLSAYVALFSRAEKTLFARLQSGGNLTELKCEFLPRFEISARQFNAMAAGIRGKIFSVYERRDGMIKEAERRIAKAKKVLTKITDPAKRHNKKRRLQTLQDRLTRLKSDRRSGTVRLCFGGKKLFNAQFHLEDTKYADHDEWLLDWQNARNNQFFVIGSKDETAGCQGCVATVAEDGSNALRARLPSALSQDGKYLCFNNIRFEQGHEAIIAAIGRNLSNNKEDWQAINYRFMRDGKGWRVLVTIALPETPVKSHKNIGVIGIDMNADHLAVTETDRFGNPTAFFSVPCVTYGKTAEQRKAVLGDAGKRIMAFVVSRRKHIVIEQLDFQKKKSAREKQSPKYARMLSALAYTEIQTIIRARAFDAGIEVKEVNPAYTSVIGQYKFADRYGMSAHTAAALAIGRRSLGVSETLPGQLHGTLPLPVRNRGRHVWSKWAVVSRKAPAALAAHRRSGTSRSLPSPIPLGRGTACDHTAWAGEIPACESSLELFE